MDWKRTYVQRLRVSDNIQLVSFAVSCTEDILSFKLTPCKAEKNQSYYHFWSDIEPRFPLLHHSPQTESTQPLTPANINYTTVCSPAEMRRSDASCHMAWPFTDIIFTISILKMAKTTRHLLYVAKLLAYIIPNVKKCQTWKCRWFTCLGEHQTKHQSLDECD